MNNCLNCSHADWYRTQTGRLSPLGVGRCTAEVEMPTLPSSKYLLGKPSVGGGHISRRDAIYDNCPTWAPIETEQQELK